MNNIKMHKSKFPKINTQDIGIPNLSKYSKDSNDPKALLERKIRTEKRRRNQAYRSLDYYLSLIHYFQFFSHDAFEISKKSKYIAQIFEKNIVTSEFLLIPYFDSSYSYFSLLKRFNITKKRMGKEFIGMKDYPIASFFDILKDRASYSFKKIINKLNNSYFGDINYMSLDISYSEESEQIFEKAAENALTRFKTPIITTEILLITMLEEKETEVGKLLKRLIPNDMEWYYFRFFLLKRLHSNELAIRNHVKKNSRYFAYLLVKESTDKEFENYIEKKVLEDVTYAFRSNLIYTTLKKPIFNKLANEIRDSIETHSLRNYTT